MVWLWQGEAVYWCGMEWNDVALAGWSCGTMYTTGPLHQGVTVQDTISALVFINRHWHIPSTNHNKSKSCTNKEQINAQ